MKNALLPCKDRVLVRQDEPEETSPGGIVIPDQAKQKPGRGKVLSVGMNVEEVREGDIVLFNKYDATRLEIEGMELTVLSEDNILLRLTNKIDESEE